MSEPRASLDDLDRRIVAASAPGLPVTEHPYRELAARIGAAPDEVMRRMRRMLERGVIRRIAAVPNHYAIGYRANGMSVWDVDDGSVSRRGAEIGALDFVSHCYRRPRVPPGWPFNLFAMVHGRSRDEVEEKVERIARLLGDDARAHAVLYSRRILKKTGLRLREGG